jgi:threonine aldolase
MSVDTSTTTDCFVPSRIFQLAARANNLHIPLHMDGARLFNAAVYLKVPASRIVRDFASASFCISKGLGAPVGAILVGDKEFIRK